MTPETVKAALLTVRKAKAEFSVAFSGKSDKKVNGFYRPDTCEIVINDRNFRSENQLLFTAIHEYAHHITMSELGVKSCKAHSPVFWATFHDLLGVAEELGAYVNHIKDDDFREITGELRDRLTEAGNVARETGRDLVKAHAFCLERDVRFEDYVLRELKQTMPWAKACMSAFLKDIPAEVGPENIKMLGAIKNPYTRKRVTLAVQERMSQMQAKVAASGKPGPVSKAKAIREEEEKIRREIMALEARLAQIGSIGATGF